VKEYRDQLKTFGKKPVLFVMMNDTEDADDVGGWLQRKYPSEFGGDKLLVIHTDKSGEVSKKDLDKARTVFAPGGSRIQSGELHRQRADVARRLGRARVTVIVGLRPYTSKANILRNKRSGAACA